MALTKTSGQGSFVFEHRKDLSNLSKEALEHEVDHLNGILYIDHLKSHQELIGEHHLPEKDSPDVTDLPLHDSP